MNDLHPNGSIYRYQQALNQGVYSSVELAQSLLQRIEKSTLHAFLDVNPEATLQQARTADAQRIEAKTTGIPTPPLLGIPIAHKDIFVTQNWLTTAGSKILKGYQSPFDATVVHQLNQAGMVTLGKLNCDEFAMGSGTDHSAYAATSNPWDTSRVPGGSSGGSAAAVAARLCPAATGTDTGGSIRQPAGFCGITGIKPTYGRCSRYGMVAFASSLDQAGPMALTAHDCALLLTAMSGPDPLHDATSLDLPAEDYSRYLGQPWHLNNNNNINNNNINLNNLNNTNNLKPLEGLRLGLPKEYFGSGCDASVEAAIQTALRTLEQLGATVVEVSLPHTQLSIPAYYVIAAAEASSNLSRFDGVKFGYRSPDAIDLTEMYKNSRSQGFGEEVQRRIMIGTYVLSHGYYDAYYLKAQKLRRLIANDFVQALTQCDLLIAPVAPSVAWSIGQNNQDPVANYLADVYTLATSLAGLPGMSVPVGFGTGHLPVGMQIIGNYLQEARMLQVADWYQRHTNWQHQQPPHA